MCGIAFLHSHKVNSDLQRQHMNSALNLMRFRGPDACNVHQEAGGTIGHVRLSILDLSDSHQPMFSKDGRFALSFNGEIYNFINLRKQLKSQWNFVTQGDTEVLLAGLILEGIKFLDKVEGMWAFLLWDIKEKRFLLSRDRTGKKPLYYRAFNNEFSCASELPALKKLCPENWEEDTDTTADYFRYGYPLPGYTFYKNTFELKPGHYLQGDANGIGEETAYWTPSTSLYKGSYHDAVSELSDTLRNSVKIRLTSDVEVGTFLSGGVDSSIITALAASIQGNHNVKAFTMGFSDSSYDERTYAKQIANYTGVEYFEDIVKDWDQQYLLDLILTRVGQPFHDSSILPTARLAKFTSNFVKVALSGDGSDELFCGYQRYKARAILKYYMMVPQPLRHLVRKLAFKFPETDAHHSRSLIRKMHLFMDTVDRYHDESPYIAPRCYDSKAYQNLFPSLASRGHSYEISHNNAEKWSEVKQMMVSDLSIYLPQDIHTKVDRATMHHSLESRSPFMDSNVVQLALSLPSEWTLSFKTNKKILKDAFEDLLPNDIWNRRKQGFAVPMASWLRGELGFELERLLHTYSSNLINIKPIEKMLYEHRSGKKNNDHRLWLIYIYLMWKNQSNM